MTEVQENHSTVQPINRDFDGLASPEQDVDRDARGNRAPKNRCRAHKKSGKRCFKAAVPGATVCKYHGGAAPQVVARAQVRIQEAADRAAKELLGMAIDETGHLFFKRPDVKLAAINSLLDRAGVKPADKLDVSVDVKPYERLIDSLSQQAQLTREESRQLRKKWIQEREDNTEDAEIVEEE